MKVRICIITIGLIYLTISPYLLNGNVVFHYYHRKSLVGVLLHCLNFLIIHNYLKIN